METWFILLKILLWIFCLFGIFVTALLYFAPEQFKKLDSALNRYVVLNIKFIQWLERDRMTFNEWLIQKRFLAAPLAFLLAIFILYLIKKF
jgi:hypothetical protein